jgi:hypothetical protein
MRSSRHINKTGLEIDVKRWDEEFVQLVNQAEAPSGSPKSSTLAKLVADAWEGMKSRRSPVLCEEGVGGVYFMPDPSNNIVGVFKPQDEEPYNINNPKGYVPRRGSDAGFKEGILVGEATLRECAAYVLDYDGFCGVPPTELVLCRHPAFHSNGISDGPTGQEETTKMKVGSFQMYKQHDGATEDIGPSFIAKFPVREVQKIALLDVRLFNTDRHGGNILYKKWTNPWGNSTYELIPIDHSYTLPSTLDEVEYFEWQKWPQAKQKMEPEIKEYIKRLDAEKDIKLLKKKFRRTFREEHFHVLRITTLLLKKAAEADLTFFDIAKWMCHQSQPSVLEGLCHAATDQCEDKLNEKQFVSKLADLLDLEIKKVTNANFKQ